MALRATGFRVVVVISDPDNPESLPTENKIFEALDIDHRDVFNAVGSSLLDM